MPSGCLLLAHARAGQSGHHLSSHVFFFPVMAFSSYRRRSWLAGWLSLPYTLLRIRIERPNDAAEEVRYLSSRGPSYSRSRPMQIILAALRRRAADTLGPVA